jgi:hypothetical protein
MHRRRVGSCWASARSSLPGSSTGIGAAMTFGSLKRPNGYCARPVGKPPPHLRNRNGTQGPGRRCLNTSGGMLPRICYLLIPWSASPRGERHPTVLSSHTAVSIAAPDGSRLYAISLRQASPPTGRGRSTARRVCRSGLPALSAMATSLAHLARPDRQARRLLAPVSPREALKPLMLQQRPTECGANSGRPAVALVPPTAARRNALVHWRTR